MRSVKEIDVSSKKVFVRVDYNVPMDAGGNITDDNRIRATLDLVQYLLEKNARIILASHLGRPKGEPDEKFSLRPVGECLSRLLDLPVRFAEDCIGETVQAMVNDLEDSQILLLENLRFHAGEKKNDPEFARQLAGLCDVYVNNAFAVSHRDQASVTGITKFVSEAAAGFLLEKEVQSYYDSVQNPRRPLLAVIGGAKVSSKLEALQNMLKFVDSMVIGGAMANTFLKSQGIDTKGSMIEGDLLDTAKRIVSEAAAKGIRLMLPTDLVCADRFDAGARTLVVPVNEVPDEWMALDIGPETAAAYAGEISSAGTIVWNGPMGVFEMEKFLGGTQIVADAIGASDAFSIVGEGIPALRQNSAGLQKKSATFQQAGARFYI